MRVESWKHTLQAEAEAERGGQHAARFLPLVTHHAKHYCGDTF
jgi:hypothetical protein